MDRPTSIILIRHGQTTLNAKKQLSGSTDPPLTELGTAQARAVARMLEPRKIDRIFSSPFSRTLDTAGKINAGRNLPVETHDGLKEQDFGEWEGKTFSDIFDMIPGGPEGLLRGPFLSRFPSGEGTEGFVSRVMGTYRDVILPGSEGNTVAVATHSGVIVILLCHFLGLDPFTHFFRLRVDNGSASAIDRYGVGLYHIQYVNRVPDLD